MIESLNSISQMWWNWMAPMFWQVSLLVILVSAIELAFKKWIWPQVRYALWALILLKLIIPPTWTLSTSIVPNVLQEFQSEKITKSEKLSSMDNQMEADKNLPAQNSNNEQTMERKILLENQSEVKTANSLPANSQSLDWKFFVMATWFLGMTVLFIFLLLRISKLRKWHAEQKERKDIPEWYHQFLLSAAERLSLERLPAIVFSKDAAAPAVYGVFRPVLLLPEKYIDSISKEEAEHVLLHELAHIKRGDLFVHGICLMLQIVYWFNPLLIWVRKEMKHVREICCDMTIANILREKTSQYRQTLLNAGRKLLTESLEPGMGLLGLFEEPFRLIPRIKWLEKKSWENRQIALITSVVIFITFSAFVLPMGELPKVSIDSKNTMNIREYSDLKDIVKAYDDKLNEAYMNWDFETIKNLFTEDMILDQEGQPSVIGLENFLWQLRTSKKGGLDFRDLDDHIIKAWEDIQNIYSLENYSFRIRLENEGIEMNGLGSAFTIWQKQKDETLKIKYSIHTLNDVPIVNEIKEKRK